MKKLILAVAVVMSFSASASASKFDNWALNQNNIAAVHSVEGNLSLYMAVYENGSFFFEVADIDNTCDKRTFNEGLSTVAVEYGDESKHIKMRSYCRGGYVNKAPETTKGQDYIMKAFRHDGGSVKISGNTYPSKGLTDIYYKALDIEKNAI